VRQYRPHGFKDYIAKQGFHSVYLVTPQQSTPVKVGIARDPLRRLVGLQNAHFEQLRLHRYWWLAGRPISTRIEQAFKEQFAHAMIRGEWFDIPLSEAEAFIESTLRAIGTWGMRQEEIARLMQQCEHHRIERSLAQITPGKSFARSRRVRWHVSRIPQ
jgi:hypothetical protein